MRSAAWLKASLLLAAAFAAGVVSGIAVERRQLVSPNSATETHDVLGYLARELDLDELQQQAVAGILKRRQSEVDAAWHAMQPHMRETLDSTSNEIAAVLRPDQVSKFRGMMEKRHAGRPH